MVTKLFDGTRSLGTTAVTGVSIEVHQCGVCGVIFGVEASFMQERRRDHSSWKCPNGHGFHFTGKSDLELLRDERDSANNSLRRERERLAAEKAKHDQTKASLTATRAAKTRFKNERDQLHEYVGAGVCPVPGCHRHFQNLQRHMERKHPDFQKEASC